MNLRPILISLGVVIPLGLGWMMKAAASWRPVLLGRFPSGVSEVASVEVLPGRIVYGGYNAWGARRFGWFDASTGQAHKDSSVAARRIGVDGEFSWVLWLDGRAAQTLEVTDADGKQRIFRGHEAYAPERGEVSVRILPKQDRVLLLVRDHLYEWEFANGHLKRVITFKENVRLPQALSRDGRTFTGTGYPDFVVGDTRSGKILKRISLRTSNMMEYSYLSAYGHYSLFDQRDNTMKVVDTSTGKALWSFPISLPMYGEWVLDSSEEHIFVRTSKDWQVRDLKTGKLVRHLALVHGTEFGAVSPNGTTLYSIAEGALYSQRVR